ncbi:MAG: N-acetylmuramic acid 6-phosphate etherase [Candidatus Marinimicrobia bacterium]|nr:N-acetylmuramic acid 6-phosphate etherase [Candidatus Neomarinimicrobiota bacterium]MBL7059422.1 N-acetylmuramic acid 6-phosphate etherase [Candidatus Neomarinimicrobiota bacterium]
MTLSRKDLTTEKQNPVSHKIDSRSAYEIIEIMNNQDATIADKVKDVLPEISRVVDMAVTAIKNGHHVFYVGAGTSGRLGVLDASEVPPTYSAPRNWFQGIIAGGREALERSIEGAEDHPEDAIRDLKEFGVEKGDLVIGIASSGATPYVVSALKYGISIHAGTAYLICNPTPLIPVDADVVIAVDVGPEIVTGSTRMKSGTATKMVLNMISTAAMIRIGKVYSNLMVDLQVVNNKLQDRGSRIIAKMTGLSYETAGDALNQSGGSVKTAVVMTMKKVNRKEAKELLDSYNGNLRGVIGDIDDTLL